MKFTFPFASGISALLEFLDAGLVVGFLTMQCLLPVYARLVLDKLEQQLPQMQASNPNMRLLAGHCSTGTSPGLTWINHPTVDG